jgi:PTS system mannose-specific IIC component
VWGTLVGLDLVSVGQFMVSRPLVAGTVAGAILGDVMAGAMVGVLLELFALDVLPVGAVRYPDYGLGAVGAAVVAAGAPDVLVIGVAVAAGLLVALLGGLGMHVVRQANGRLVRRHRTALDAGEVPTIYQVHLQGALLDAVRALLVTAAGIGVAIGVGELTLVTVRGAILATLAVVGVALGTATAGAMRLGGRGLGMSWLALGMVVGATMVVLR